VGGQRLIGPARREQRPASGSRHRLSSTSSPVPRSSSARRSGPPGRRRRHHCGGPPPPRSPVRRTGSPSVRRSRSRSASALVRALWLGCSRPVAAPPPSNRSARSASRARSAHGRSARPRRNALVGVDEAHERGVGRSSSAAKKAEAARRISLARRSSLISRRSLRSSADFSEVSPGRRPASISAWCTQVRSVSASLCPASPRSGESPRTRTDTGHAAPPPGAPRAGAVRSGTASASVDPSQKGSLYKIRGVVQGDRTYPPGTAERRTKLSRTTAPWRREGGRVAHSDRLSQGNRGSP
jgi:hypothetical protein